MNHVRSLIFSVVGGVVALVLVALAAYSVGAHGRGKPGDESVTVAGAGKVSVVPDLLIVDLSVRVTRPTNAEALAESNAVQRKVTEALEKAGVARKDIRTTGFSVNPHMVYGRDGERQEGYDASHSVRIYARDLDTAGEILGDAVSAGGNAVEVQNTRLTLSDKSEAMGKARAKAVKDARARAQAYADASGRELGRVLRIKEYSASAGYRPAVAFDALSAKVEGGASVPIEPGEQKLSVSVQVVFTLD